MDATHLRRFDAFESLPPDALQAVAERIRPLRMPARRWVIRPGGQLPGHCYLYRGRVRLLTRQGAGTAVSAGSARARRAVYPGTWGVASLTDVELLYLDASGLVLPWHPEGSGQPEIEAAEGGWQMRFLSSPLMQRLTPAAWQRVLRAMRAESFAAGELIVRAGDPADRCYVLRSGSAVIRSGRRTLARLQPGDFFGEDALVSRGCRNASVCALEPASTMGLPAAEFDAWLLQPVVQPLDELGDRVPLHLDRVPLHLDGADGAQGIAVALHEVRALAARLPAGRGYAVLGANLNRRMLAAFMLAQRGLDARPLLL